MQSSSPRCHDKSQMRCRVERKTRHRKKEGIWEMQVHWRGFDPDEATWETLQTITEDLPVMTLEYIASLISGTKKAALRVLLPPTSQESPTWHDMTWDEMRWDEMDDDALMWHPHTSSRVYVGVDRWIDIYSARSIGWLDHPAVVWWSCHGAERILAGGYGHTCGNTPDPIPNSDVKPVRPV